MAGPTTLQALLEGADVRTFDYDYLDVEGDSVLRLTRAQSRAADVTLDADGNLDSDEGAVNGVRTVRLGRGSPLKVTGRIGEARVRAGDTVRLTATVEGLQDGEVPRVRWTFPGGGRQEGEAVRHRFTRPGRYAVVVGATTRSQRAGASDIVTVVVEKAPTSNPTPSPSPSPAPTASPPSSAASSGDGGGGGTPRPRATAAPTATPAPTATAAPTPAGKLVAGLLLGGSPTGGGGAPRPAARPAPPEHGGLDIPPGVPGAGVAVLLALAGYRHDMRRSRLGWR